MQVCSVVRREDRAERLRHALQAIGDRDQRVGHTTRPEVVEHLHPELGALRGLDPQAQYLARAIPAHAKRQIGAPLSPKRR